MNMKNNILHKHHPASDLFSGGTQPARSASNALPQRITEEHKVNLTLTSDWNNRKTIRSDIKNPPHHCTLTVNAARISFHSHHSGVWPEQRELLSTRQVRQQPHYNKINMSFKHSCVFVCVCVFVGSGWRTPWRKTTPPVFYCSLLAPRRTSV